MGKYKLQNKGLCSIEIKPDGVAFAYVASQISPEIVACDFFPFSDGKLNKEQIRQFIDQIVSSNNLRGGLCTWVLHRDFYQITLMNTPSVPQKEQKNAIRWQIKDIIDYPLEDAAIDTFYPDDPEIIAKKVYVVVAQNSFLQGIVDIFQEYELYPVAIDATEFSARNLLMKVANPDESVGLLDLTEKSCLVITARKNNVKFVRRIPIGYRNASSNNYASLVTEIQRSFDYCKEELNQKKPSKLFLSPQIELDDSLSQIIEDSLGVEVRVIDLKKIVDFKTPPEDGIVYRCWSAIGGVFRDISS